MAAGGGAMGALGVIVTGVVKLLGSRKERDAGFSGAAQEWRSLAEEARQERRECELRSERLEAAIDAVRQDLRSLEDRHADLARVHAGCPDSREFTELKAEVRRLSMQSTPPVGAYTPEDVRRALEESGG